MKFFFALALSSFWFSVVARADVPSSFSYQGRILKANGVDADESANVTFKIQILSADGTCLLYEENHQRNMTGTSGIFSLIIGQGANTNATALALAKVFDNSGLLAGSGCSYTPMVGDARRLRFLYNDGVETVLLPTDQVLRSVPYAFNAEAVQGLNKNKILQVSTTTTQAGLDALLVNSSALQALATGTSTQYAPASSLPFSNGVLDLTSSGVTVPDVPASGTSAVNKDYSDAYLGGRAIDLTGLTAGSSLAWNATTSKWQPSAPVGTAGTYTKVTTDNLGRVVSGSSLIASDLPSAAGDVSGPLSALTVEKIQSISVSPTTPASGQVLTFNSTTAKWEPQTLPASAVVTASAPLVNSSSHLSLTPGNGRRRNTPLGWLSLVARLHQSVGLKRDCGCVAISDKLCPQPNS